MSKQIDDSIATIVGESLAATMGATGAQSPSFTKRTKGGSVMHEVDGVEAMTARLLVKMGGEMNTYLMSQIDKGYVGSRFEPAEKLAAAQRLVAHVLGKE